MELELITARIVHGDPDMSFEIGDQAREWAARMNGSEMLLFEVIERLKFYYPVSRNYRGTIEEMKFLTYPGEGYFPDQPWCTFNTDSSFHLNTYLDLTPYI